MQITPSYDQIENRLLNQQCPLPEDFQLLELCQALYPRSDSIHFRANTLFQLMLGRMTLDRAIETCKSRDLTTIYSLEFKAAHANLISVIKKIKLSEPEHYLSYLQDLYNASETASELMGSFTDGLLMWLYERSPPVAFDLTTIQNCRDYADELSVNDRTKYSNVLSLSKCAASTYEQVADQIAGNVDTLAQNILDAIRSHDPDLLSKVTASSSSLLKLSFDYPESDIVTCFNDTLEIRNITYDRTELEDPKQVIYRETNP